MNSGRERNVNYVIRESRYLTGNNYHDRYDKLDCSIENAKYYTENAEKMSKDERIAASMWATRCVFDRILKRDRYAKKLDPKNQLQILEFLKHEHVIRLFINCSSALRDWDEKWVSTLFYVSGMLVSFPDSTLKAITKLSTVRGNRNEIVSRVKSLTSSEIYNYMIRRLKNAIANRKPLTKAFLDLSGRVEPVVARIHRNLKREEKKIMNKSKTRISRNP